MSGDIGQFLILLGYAAILVVLVRTGNGGTFVTSVGGAMASIINAATGGGTSTSSSSGGGGVTVA